MNNKKATAKKKNASKRTTYTPAITRRFLVIMEETVKEGTCESNGAFLESIGEYRQNLYGYLDGSRNPTLEQLATTCTKYGYSPTWVLLGMGDKRMKAGDNKSIEARVTELEASVARLNKLIKLK
jgi:hypothetical protein